MGAEQMLQFGCRSLTLVTSLYDIQGLERDAKQYMKSINLKLALGDVVTQIKILERDVKFQTLKSLERKISIIDLMNLKKQYILN